MGILEPPGRNEEVSIGGDSADGPVSIHESAECLTLHKHKRDLGLGEAVEEDEKVRSLSHASQSGGAVCINEGVTGWGWEIGGPRCRQYEADNTMADGFVDQMLRIQGTPLWLRH